MKNMPLYLQISNDIMKQICSGSLKSGERVLSESEISEKYRVSSITAKNALIDLCDKQYIIRIKGKGSFVNAQENLEQLPEYIQSRHNRSRAQIKAIGLILPTMKTKVDQDLLNAIELEISKTDYMLLISITHESQERESEVIQRFVQNGVNGLIIFPTEKELYSEDILKLSIEQFPFIFVDRYLKGLKANTVTTNNYEITKYVISRMIKTRKENILFISPNSNNSVTWERMHGFEDALLDHNIPINRSNYCLVDLAIESFDGKYAAIKKFLNTASQLDGIFCANQEMASITMKVLEDQCPERIPHLELCCFDWSESRYFNYIRQDIGEIGRSCVKLLIDAISGKADPVQVTVAAEYIGVKGR